MESRSPSDGQAPADNQQRSDSPPVGDVTAALVRRINQADLTPASVATAVAEVLAAPLGGTVAVLLRDRRSGATRTAVRQDEACTDLTLRRTIEEHTDDRVASKKDFVDVVLETGESFVAPDAKGFGSEDIAADQHLMAVPVVARDGTVGVIAAARDDDEPFSGDELELMTRVADVAALAVSGASSPDQPRASSDDRGRTEAACALDSAADAIFVVGEDGEVLRANPATHRLLGFSDSELVGRALRDIVADGSAFAPRRSTDLPDLDSLGVGAVSTLHEIDLRRDDGTVIAVELSIGRVAAAGRKLFVAVGRDVSHRKRIEAGLRREASVDPLTGLVNRASAHRALGRSMQRVDAGCQVALLFIDLDGFKVINDSAGHQAGDEVLRAVAERLTESVRHDDLVARYGGDEFLVVLEADEEIEHQVAAVCARIESAFREPFAVGSSWRPLGASIGRAIQGRDGFTISQLLAHADTDMYRQKQARRSAEPTP